MNMNTWIELKHGWCLDGYMQYIEPVRYDICPICEARLQQATNVVFTTPQLPRFMNTWMKPDQCLQVVFIQISILTNPYIECDSGNGQTLDPEGIIIHADWVE